MQQLEKNSRYEKSKYKNGISSKLTAYLYIIFSLALSVLGIALILDGDNAGYFCFVPILFLYMVHEWYEYDLKKMKPNLNSDNPYDYLRDTLVSRAKTTPSSMQDFINWLSKDSGRLFMANRFLIADEILKLLEVSDYSKIYETAKELFIKFPVSSGVDGSHLTVSLIINASNKNDILKTINYSEEELMNGLGWYSYLVGAIESMRTKQSSGGMARDWATGYTPLLNRFAENISYSIQYGGTTHRDIFSREKVVDQCLTVFSSKGRANIALVGATGSGKHICVQGLADRLLFGNVPVGLKYSQIYQIDASNLLTSFDQSQIEQALNQILSEAYHAKNIIIFFNNGGALFGCNSSYDASNFMQPIISAGRVRMIFSFTDTEWQYINREKPGLSAVFNYQAVNQTEENETIKILENEAIFVEHQLKCLFTYESLKEIYRLALRYGPEVAMPAKAISVMETAGRGGGLVTSTTVQSAIEQTTGIKVGSTTADEKNKLLNLQDEIKKLVVGQEKAVTEVVNALKRNRSGVSSSNKPIGTFLFLGPTGVGKTELTKALATCYFNDKSNFIRLDMNEYITKDSVHKLLETGNTTSPSFLDKVKQKPFSVVLLDEIEKADESIINIFLQLLDEGVIIDGSNKEVSFRDTIVIATSNAGAEEIRNSIGAEKPLNAQDLINYLITNNKFKPEFINRFDETIIFEPLSRDNLKQVVSILLGQINNELTNQKITVVLSEDAINWLSENGHDPVMGARPLRRLMQKTIESIVADKILSQQINAGDRVTIDSGELENNSNIN
jgi:ATP-dependent Clp protease ATP-binding subunit ClpA